MEVRPIKSQECQEWLLCKHYARRSPTISYAFGLFDAGVLVGVMTIGKPASPAPCIGVCGPQNADLVFELNRLVVNDGLPKNSLSFFVGRSLRLINDTMILLSYADTAQGHHGYIYQATNWIYTGATKERTDPQMDGKHARHQRGIDLSVRDVRSSKHRYVYFLGKRSKELRGALRWPVCAYPKGANQRYDTSYQPTTQALLW